MKESVPKASGKEESASEARRVIPRKACAFLVLLVILVCFPAVGFGTIQVKDLTDGSTAGPAASYSTASFTPDANTLILAWIAFGDLVGDTPTLSGNGVTWVQVGSTLPFSQINSPKMAIALFMATAGPAPTGGSVTITFPEAEKECMWSILQFSGVDSSSPLVQSVSNRADALNGAFTLSLSALGNAANATVAGFSNEAGSMIVGAPNYSTLVSGLNPVMSLQTEWYLPGNPSLSMSTVSSHDIAGIALEIKSAVTVLGNGSDPANATIAPGGAATMVDSFTFRTTGVTAAISNVTANLAAGTSTYLSLIEITDSTGSTVFGSVSNPSSDTVSIPLTTNITATTTATTYRIRITPKSHASMPPPPGGSYQVTAYVSNWTDSYPHLGTDSGGTTITIDNQSPANVTSPYANHGNAQVALSWTNPADSDLGSIVVLRKAGSAVTDVPTEGASYLTGNTVGSSTVACVLASPGASCTDTGLTNGTFYYYKIFAKDTSGNYSANGTDAYYYLPDLMIKLSSEGDVAYLGANVYETTASSQVKLQGVVSGSTAGYKVRVQNAGTHADDLVITGTASGANFTVQYLDDSATDRTAAVTGAGYTVAGLAVGAYKDWTVNVTPNGGATPVPGGTAYNVLVTGTSSADPTKKDQVKAATSSTSASITLLKSSDKGSYNPGEDITYTIVASNGASLTSAGSVVVSDPISANTGFKLGGATFAAGSSTLTGALGYSNGSFGYTPVSGGCSAPAGYDYCVTQVRWIMTGSMPTGTSFTCTLVVRVK